MRPIVRCSVLVLLLCGTAFAQQDDPRIAAFRAFAAEAMKAQQVQGLSVAVVYGDYRWSGGLGLADVENGVPATEKSSYRMASVTKPMTAVAVLKLAEEGKIDLDAEVQRYVPWFPKKPQPVTIRQLLSHQGGISHYRDYSKEGTLREAKTTREAIEIFAGWDLVAEPGTAYRYTTYGYNLLGAVIEGAAGRPYAEVMAEKVWKPLGMSSTLMDDPRAVIANRVPGYVVENRRLRRSEYVDVSSRFAGGGTRSTVDDIVRVVEGLAAGKVVRPETLDRAWTAVPTRDGRLTSYGLGFGVYPRNGRWVVGHTGSQQETRTRFAHVPRKKFTVALASNYEHADLGVFEDELLEIFLGEPPARGAYFDEREDAAVWRTMHGVYSSGLAYYDRHGRAATEDRRELDAAFRYVRAALAGDESKILDGRNAFAGEPFVKAGSWMASVLAPSGGIDRHHRDGALAFFADYARVARRYRLDRAVVSRLGAWSAESARVWTPEIVTLDVRRPGSLELLEKHRAQLAAAKRKPDFSGELAELAEQRATDGDFAGALRAAELGLSIYPRSEPINGVLGVLTVVGGDRARGIELLRTANEIDPKGFARAQNLLQIASFLSDASMKDGAAALLAAAAELYPDDPSVRERMAESKK